MSDYSVSSWESPSEEFMRPDNSYTSSDVMFYHGAFDHAHI